MSARISNDTESVKKDHREESKAFIEKAREI